VYQPTHYNYQRIKEQIEQNDKHRSIEARQKMVNNIVDRLEITDPTKDNDTDIVKKQLEIMFEQDQTKAKKLANADNSYILEVYNKIIKDAKK
jgi:hypothetical protein